MKIFYIILMYAVVSFASCSTENSKQDSSEKTSDSTNTKADTNLQPEVVKRAPNIAVDEVIIIALSLNNVTSTVPKLIDKGDPGNLIMAKINQQILKRFDLNNYDNKQEDFYWSGITGVYKFAEDKFHYKFNGDYIAARLIHHEEELIFDLTTGELITSDESDDVQNDPVNYQKGLLMPDEDVYIPAVCCKYTQAGGFKLYNAKGERTGMILGMAESEHGPITATKLIIGSIGDENERDIDPKYYTEVTYEEYALTYFERNNGLMHVLNSEEDWWVKESDLEADEFVSTNWQKFLIDKTGDLMGYYSMHGTTLPLKTNASAESEQLMEVATDLYEITPTGDINGNWVKVIVKVYDAHICEGGTVQEQKEGWMELTTKEGDLLVRNYARGC